MKVKQRRLSVEKEPKDIEIIKFRQEFFNGLKEMDKYDRSTKLSVKEVLPLYPDAVCEMGRIVTATPPTQVSVERLFSGLKIVKSDLRASMKEDLAEAILFLRTKC